MGLSQLLIYAMVAMHLYSSAATVNQTGNETGTTSTMTTTTTTYTMTGTTVTGTTATSTATTVTGTTVTGTTMADTNTTTHTTTVTTTTALTTETSTATTLTTITLTTTMTIRAKATVAGTMDLSIDENNVAAFMADPDVKKGISETIAQAVDVPVEWVEVALSTTRRLQMLRGDTRRLGVVNVKVSWKVNIPENSAITPSSVADKYENFATYGNPELKIKDEVRKAQEASGKTPSQIWSFGVESISPSAEITRLVDDDDGTTATEAAAESGLSTGLIIVIVLIVLLLLACCVGAVIFLVMKRP